MSFVVVAKFQVKSDKNQEFKELITKTAEQSWLEAGLVKYILVEDPTQPNLFTLVEFFATESDFQAHRESAHLAKFREQVSDLLATAPEVVRGIPTLANRNSKADI
ncbi:MAG: antibiotic biosynthesis monooxygenase [Actinobacteria bacterium]|nr:antibiotic biosynthesis monooxygenase [Actinomycetota bacterium]